MVSKLSSRLTSLDVFRGITIAGMILVNKISLEEKAYPFLLHADWNGCTFTDLIFPFFLFIMGVAMAFSLKKYQGYSKINQSIYFKIITRSLILFILGLLLNGFWNYDLSNIRILGVLQRISLTYFFASLAILILPKRGLFILTGIILMGYWLTMMYIPIPEFGMGNLTRIGNFGAYIDRLIIPSNHLYQGDGFNGMGDPEGLFSTLPCIATVLIGYLCGNWLQKQTPETKVTTQLIMFGLSSMIIGKLWDFIFPINKKLWTSSYVMFTVGFALILLAICYELIEVNYIKKWSKPFEILGLNALFIFVSSVLLIKLLVKIKIGEGENILSIYQWIYQNLFLSWTTPALGSLLFGIITVILWWLIAYILYLKKVIIKV
jgi:predicted acyltransferase